MKTSPFAFVKEIQTTKKDLMVDPQCEKEYVPWLTNRALSYQDDCIFQADEMNRRHHLDNRLQYSYLLGTVRSMKRGFPKWSKPETAEDLEAVKLVFGYSDKRAMEALRILTTEQIAAIVSITQEGGTGKHK
jgi:hypothetical protein